jgi:hypothetical protein
VVDWDSRGRAEDAEQHARAVAYQVELDRIQGEQRRQVRMVELEYELRSRHEIAGRPGFLAESIRLQQD